MQTKYNHIYFEVIDIKPKTKVWGCLNNISKFQLGIVKWYPSWRRYCFFPDANAAFDVGCLTDIIHFINQLERIRDEEKPMAVDGKVLDDTDIGRWVEYTHHLEVVAGRIKAWNNKWVFVVYKCDGNWDDYLNFTATATDRKELKFIEPPEGGEQ